MKTTKKNVVGKKMMVGIALFSAFALVGTGFAAFIISTNKPQEITGAIEIGKVEEKSVNINDIALSNTKIAFEPKAEDAKGRVRYDGKESEALSTTLTFTFDQADTVDAIHIDLEVPEGIRKAASDNYITLPEIAAYKENTNELIGLDIKADGSTTSAVVSDTEGKDNTKSVSYTFSFGWGSVFNSKNPGEYYDTDENGKLVSDSEMKSTLEAFQKELDAAGTMTVNLSVKLN